MTNREAATLALHLVGFYWLVTGLIQAVSTLGSLMVSIASASPDMAWVKQPIVIMLVILQASAYPVVGAFLFFKADSLAMRWSSKPDEVVPAIITLTTGTALLGIYFLVLGLHGAFAPAQRWIITAQFDNFSTTALAEAVVYLSAGALLLARPRWLMGPVSQAH